MSPINQQIYDSTSKYTPYDEREAIDKEVILEFVKNNDEVLSRNNKIAHFAVSAWITNPNHTKILMVHHNIYNSWSWVGGHADGDADFLRVIQKEISEETRLDKVKLLHDQIFSLCILTVPSHIKRGKIVNAHLHLDVEYLFEADETATTRTKLDENSGVKWVNIDEVEKVVNESETKPIYHRLNQKLLQFFAI